MRAYKRRRNASAGHLKIEPHDVYRQEVELQDILESTALSPSIPQLIVMATELAETILLDLQHSDMMGGAQQT